MEKYPMNRSYHNSCSMPSRMPCSDHMSPGTARFSHGQHQTACPDKMTTTSMYSHVDHMEPAMAYVPCQHFESTYDLCYALHAGTIFPELCKPFCGKRGGMRC